MVPCICKINLTETFRARMFIGLNFSTLNVAQPHKVLPHSEVKRRWQEACAMTFVWHIYYDLLPHTSLTSVLTSYVLRNYLTNVLRLILSCVTYSLAFTRHSGLIRHTFPDCTARKIWHVANSDLYWHIQSDATWHFVWQMYFHNLTGILLWGRTRKKGAGLVGSNEGPTQRHREAGIHSQ